VNFICVAATTIDRYKVDYIWGFGIIKGRGNPPVVQLG
jgi:hypothetical protein